MTIHYPLQSFGIGDCIFTAALGKHWVEQGDRVIWGVEPHFVEALNRAYPFITYVDKRILSIDYNVKVRMPYADGIIEPIRWSDSIMKVPYWQVMRAKYDMYGLDFNMWRDVKPQRYLDKEYELANKLGITLDGYGNPNKYNLISPYYGSNSQFIAPIEVNNGLPNIYMNSIERYSIFDWQVVIENAFTIHAVSSSIVYLLELLSLNATEVHLYPRHMEKDTWWKNIEYLTTKKYEIH